MVTVMYRRVMLLTSQHVIYFHVVMSFLTHSGVVEERPPHMIVKHFGCTAIHNKALYKCIIHSFTISLEKFAFTYIFVKTSLYIQYPPVSI